MNERVKKYSDNIMRCVRQSMGLEPDDISQDKCIESMGKHEVFDRYMTWNGIIGYSYEIETVIENIYGVNLIDD